MEKAIDDVLFHLQEWRRFRSVLLLVVIQVGVFVYSGLGHFTLFGMITAERLDDVGALNTELVDNGELWRLLASIFLHAGWVHLIVNTLNIYALGALVNRLYGTLWMWMSFVICGLSGSVLTWAMGTPRTVGASGAIFGWMGILWVLGWKHRSDLTGEGGRLFRYSLAVWSVVSLLIGWWIPFIDNAAHIGGLLVGVALGMTMDPKNIVDT